MITIMKKFCLLFLVLALGLSLTACPGAGSPVENGDGTEESSENGGDSGNGGNSGSGGDSSSGGGSGTTAVTGSNVTQVNNGISVITGDSFTTSGDYAAAAYISKRISVDLKNTEADIVPVGDLYLFGRPLSGGEYTVYYFLQVRNNTADRDFEDVFVNGKENVDQYDSGIDFYDAESGGIRLSRKSAHMSGRVRNFVSGSKTSQKRGLAPGDNGWLFTSASDNWMQLDMSEWDAIKRAELDTSSVENNNVLKDADCEFTVLGYSYGDVEGETRLTVNIQNTGATAGVLQRNSWIILRNGDNVVYHRGSNTRFPSDGLLYPGETGGYYAPANDLGNVTADRVIIMYDFQEAP